MLIEQTSNSYNSRHQMYINSCLASLPQIETFTKLNLIIDIIYKDRIFKNVSKFDPLFLYEAYQRDLSVKH